MRIPVESPRGSELLDETGIGVRGARVETTHSCDVRIVPVVSADHSFAAGETPPRSSLHAPPQIVLRDSAQQPDAPSLNVLDGGLLRSVTDVAAKRDVILAGMGWGGLPEHVVAADLATGRLATLSVPEFDTVTMTPLTMRRRDRAHGVVARALWEQLRRASAARRASATVARASRERDVRAVARARVRRAGATPKPRARRGR